MHNVSSDPKKSFITTITATTTISKATKIYVEFEGNGFHIEIYPLMRVVQIKDNYLIFDLLI